MWTHTLYDHLRYQESHFLPLLRWDIRGPIFRVWWPHFQPNNGPVAIYEYVVRRVLAMILLVDAHGQRHQLVSSDRDSRAWRPRIVQPQAFASQRVPQ